MRLKPAAHLYGLQSLYPNYDITGPFAAYSSCGQDHLGEKYTYASGPFSICYLLFTSKSDPGAFFYQAYEYSVWENHNLKKLRANHRIEFKKYAFNYSRTNIRSTIVSLPEGESHPLRGYGCFTSIEALIGAYGFWPNIFDGKRVVVDSLDPRPPTDLKRAYRRTLPDGMVVPESVLCMHCKLPLVLTRNRRYLYIYKNKRNFLHTECIEGFLAKQRAAALNVRRERALLRKQGDFIPIKLTNYIAKPELSYKDASAYDEAYFNEHYKDVGKDYIPAQILKSSEESIPLGANEPAIIDVIKRWLGTKDAMRMHTQGPSYMLFQRIPSKGSSPIREFIHASW